MPRHSLGTAAALVLLASLAPAFGQAANRGGAVTGAFAPVGQVGVSNNPLNNFGIVGGRYTQTSNSLLANAGRTPAPPPSANYLGQVNYQVDIGGVPASGGSRPNLFQASLNRNLLAAGAYFGPDRATTVLGRISHNPNGPLYQAMGARRATGRRGLSVGELAGASLDRTNSLLLPRSPLARLAAGSRTLTQFSADAPDELSAPTDAPAIATPEQAVEMLIPPDATPDQRRALRVAHRARDYVERGDDLMRQGKYREARGLYDIARITAPDDPTPHFRMFVAALLMDDVAQSSIYLKHGLRRMTSLEQCRVIPAECLPSEETLRTQLRRFAQASLLPTASSGEHMVYSYLAFVFNDTTVARTEARKASELAPHSSELARFAEFLNRQTTSAAPRG